MGVDIVGSGLLAKAFSKSKAEDCFFCCSGVSDSHEVRVSEFNRERKLILSLTDLFKEKCFVYFSSSMCLTCYSPYYLHKLEMEELVISRCPSYHIIRLPQVVGVSAGKTIVPSFVKLIDAKEPVHLYINATRNIVDVDDVVRVFDLMHDKSNTKKTRTICAKHNITPMQLVDVICEILHEEKKLYV